MKKRAVLLVFVVGLSYVTCGVTINGVQCGAKRCKRDEYCSPLQKSCEKCDQICDNSTHNYDLPMCMEKCQDYLHDLRYGNTNLRETVQRLSNMVNVTLVMVCFLFIGIAVGLGIWCYRWKKKKNITLDTIKSKIFAQKNISEPDGIKSNNVNSSGEKHDLRIQIPHQEQNTQSDHSPVTVTTSISRRPAEDSTLDYAYDNPAMATTPNSAANYKPANEGRL